jgi:hypothetical protein
MQPIGSGLIFGHCEKRSDEAIHDYRIRAVDCFAEPVIGRRFAPTRWLAMTVVGGISRGDIA